MSLTEDGWMQHTQPEKEADVRSLAMMWSSHRQIDLGLIPDDRTYFIDYRTGQHVE